MTFENLYNFQKNVRQELKMGNLWMDKIELRVSLTNYQLSSQKAAQLTDTFKSKQNQLPN